MVGINLTTKELDFFDKKLTEILAFNPSIGANKNIVLLKSKLSECRKSGNHSFPELRPEVENVISAFKPFSKLMAKDIALGAKAVCKGCVFHNDSCLVNFLYIIFKSVELNKNLEFKNLRPNIREDF
jgi:hypothetical protein